MWLLLLFGLSYYLYKRGFIIPEIKKEVTLPLPKPKVILPPTRIPEAPAPPTVLKKEEKKEEVKIKKRPIAPLRVIEPLFMVPEEKKPIAPMYELPERLKELKVRLAGEEYLSEQERRIISALRVGNIKRSY